MRVLRWIRDAWVILGVTLLLVLVADRVLDAVLADRPGWLPVNPGVAAPDREQAPAYADASWVDRYWQEHDAAKTMSWSPYVYWHREPFAGETINIDEQAIRRSWMPAEPVEPVVWILGGSAVWGTGVPDDLTVPSQLARLLAESGDGARVVNFGESGYVSTQSLIRLHLELQRRPAPDAVIFLEGANDVFAALQAGRAGWPQNESHRQMEFRSSQGLDEYLALFPALLTGLGKLAPARPPAAPASLAEEVLATLVHNVNVAEALARSFGFRLFYVWQPTVFGRPSPSEYESRVIGASLAAHRELQLAADGRVVEQGLLFTLADAIAADPQPLFLDFVHLGPRGNRLVAEAMFAALRTCPPGPGLCRP